MKNIILLFVVALYMTSCSMLSNPTTYNESKVEEFDGEENDFVKVLNALKDVHPGTAGSSLKVMYAAYNFLNSCRSRLPFESITADWISKQDNNNYKDINESFNFVYENLDKFKSEKIKGLLSDAGIELPDGVSFEGVIDEAKKVLKIVIDKTK